MDFDALIGLPSVISSILGIVTILIFLFVYFSVHMAIKTGQLKPIAKQRTPTWAPLPYFVPVMPYQPFQPMQPQYAPPPQPQPAPPPKSQP